MNVSQRFAKMTPSIGTPYSVNALATNKNALQTTLGTFLLANASAMDPLFNGLKAVKLSNTNALVDKNGTSNAANVFNAQTKVSVLTVTSLTH
jgi:hypothetical protein